MEPFVQEVMTRCDSEEAAHSAEHQRLAGAMAGRCRLTLWNPS